MNNYIKIILGILVSGACLFLAFKGFHWTDLSLALTQASWEWLIPAFLLSTLSYALRTLRWKILISPMKAVKFTSLFTILTFGFLINNILPLRIGELARVYGLKKIEDVRLSAGLGSVALERITDVLGVLFVIFLSMGVLPRKNVPVIQFILLFLFGISIVVGLLVFFEKKGDELIKKDGLVGKIALFLKNITDGFSALKSPSKITLTLLATVAVWSVDVATLAVVSRVFALNLSLVQSAAVIVGISFGVMIPAAPGYVGTYEFFAKQTLVFLGFPAGPALSFILVIHFFQVLVSMLFGLPGLLKIGLSSVKFKIEREDPASQ